MVAEGTTARVVRDASLGNKDRNSCGAACVDWRRQVRKLIWIVAIVGLLLMAAGKLLGGSRHGSWFASEPATLGQRVAHTLGHVRDVVTGHKATHVAGHVDKARIFGRPEFEPAEGNSFSVLKLVLFGTAVVVATHAFLH